MAELNEFSNLGKGPETMKVPYAKKWQKETDKLRQIALDCDLTEELKWGKPCFTFLKKNVAIVIPLKESCAFSFFKGVLLKDPKHVLERIGEEPPCRLLHNLRREHPARRSSPGRKPGVRRGILPCPPFRIGRLAVDQRFQGRGLGAALLADAASRTLKADAAAFTLLVDAKNDSAVAFYQRFGFRILASQPRTLFLPLATAQKVLLREG